MANRFLPAAAMWGSEAWLAQFATFLILFATSYKKYLTLENLDRGIGIEPHAEKAGSECKVSRNTGTIGCSNFDVAPTKAGAP
jgi:hypothetical protein